MLVRIVKMSFNPVHHAEFLALFDEKKELIRKRTGCRLLELYRVNGDSNVFFTYSYWETDADLQAYRNSQLFKDTWAKTKVLFNEKPEAWSVDKLISLP